MSSTLDADRQRAVVLEAEPSRLTDRIVAGDDFSSIRRAMATREMELQSIRDRLLISTGADSLAADIDDIRRFVTKKLNDLTGLHHQDVSEAREWLSEYVGKIIMTPNGNHYIASGKWEWDLLGGKERPAFLGREPVRMRMVAGGRSSPKLTIPSLAFLSISKFN